MKDRTCILGGKTMYNNKKDKEKDTKYRKVEAMWRRGCSIDEIVRSVKLSKNGRTRCYTENICIGYETSLTRALSFSLFLQFLL